MSKWTYDPLSVKGDPEAKEKLEKEEGKVPANYFFEGSIIFISNLSMEQINPDKALRTRGFIIEINPTDKEVVDFVEDIIDDIKLPVDRSGKQLKLDKKGRKKVFEVVKKNTHGEFNVRKVCRGLALAAAGIRMGKIDNDVRIVITRKIK